MAEFVKLNPAELVELHEQNERLMSYNVEFAEVPAGTIELAPMTCTFLVV